MSAAEAISKFLEEVCDADTGHHGQYYVCDKRPVCLEGRDQRKKLTFSPEKGVGYCYRCRKTFRIWDIVLMYDPEVENIAQAYSKYLPIFYSDVEDTTYMRKTMEDLVPQEDSDKEYGIFEEKEQHEYASVELPPGFCLVQGSSSAEAKSIRRYFLRRRLRPSYIENLYSIGYSNFGPWRGRVVAPVFNDQGELRLLTSRLHDTDMDAPKTYHRGANCCLYGYHTAHFCKDLGVIVEGPTDVWNNEPCFVGLLGKNLTKGHMSQLEDWNPRTLVIMLDNDARTNAGELALELLGNRMIKSDIYVSARFPRDSIDPGNATPKQMNRVLKGATRIKNSLDALAIVAESGFQ